MRIAQNQSINSLNQPFIESCTALRAYSRPRPSICVSMTPLERSCLAELKDDLKVLIIPQSDNTVVAKISSVRCAEPGVDGVVYSGRRFTGKPPQIRYSYVSTVKIQPEAGPHQYEVRGLQLWAKYTFKLFMWCKNDLTRRYNQLDVHTRGKGKHCGGRCPRICTY